jgi:hypothetical protein
MSIKARHIASDESASVHVFAPARWLMFRCRPDLSDCDLHPVVARGLSHLVDPEGNIGDLNGSAGALNLGTGGTGNPGMDGSAGATGPNRAPGAHG